MEIMKLVPTGKDYLWGGTRLREEYRKKIDLTPLAETWECSVHPDGPSYVANGEFKGLALAEVLKQHPEYIGTKVEDGKLPVLVKFIDAKKDLSVQVHPSDEYARKHEGDNGKTEMWYVIDAEEGAHLIYGFQHEVTEEILRKAVETGNLDKHLQKVEVHKGDTYFVPAGTVHGIGKGILVAEIQESSNVTYRVYDYNRVDKNGKKRELHFDKAVQVMDTDGKPLLWIAKWYGTPIKEKISGSDLFPLLCDMAAKKEYKMFFLGAAEGVAAKAAENLAKRYKGLQVVGTYSPPYGFEKNPEEMDKIKGMIKEAKPHILIVGLGCPKQEKFMYHHCEELGVPISFGLGASFDFEAGNIKRAPRWMADHGLEWLFRITQDPKRMAKRYLVDDRKILGLAIKYRKVTGK